MSGKWHVGSARGACPDRRGFERSFALIGGATNYFGTGPQHTDANVMQFALDGTDWSPPRDGFFTTDAFTDRAVKFLRARPDATRPFFLYLAYTAPHWPLHAHEADVEKYRGKYLAGWTRSASGCTGDRPSCST